jgi:hypothetical protein
MWRDVPTRLKIARKRPLFSAPGHHRCMTDLCELPAHELVHRMTTGAVSSGR